MKLASVCMLLMALTVSSSAIAAVPPSGSSLQQHYEALLRIDDKLLDRGAPYAMAELLQAAQPWLVMQDIPRLEDSDLEPAFRAALLLAARTFSQAQVENARLVLDEMRRRSLARTDHYARMAMAYLSIWNSA